MEYEPCLQQGKRPTTRRTPRTDGVEAWSVAFAACVINFIMAGLGRMSGILYVAFIDIFHTDRRQASLPFSVRASTRNLLGPLVGILGQKYGIRPVIIVGGIIGTLSAASCFYVEDILWMTIVWGGFNGIGTALTTTLPQVIIGQHFKKYRSTAAGMSFSGGCIGSFLFPVLLEFLLYKYNLGGTFLIISGIIMNVIPAAMILRTPTWLNKKQPLILVSSVNDDISHVASETQIQNGEDEKCGRNGDKANILHKNELDFSGVKYSPNIDVTCNLSENSTKRLLNDKGFDTHLLWDNRKLVLRLLTDDFTLQIPGSEVNQNKSFTKDTSIEEIENLFYKIVTNVQNDNIFEKDSAPDISFKGNSMFEDKCSQLKNGTHINESSKSQSIDFVKISSNPLNCLSFYLENLFKRDRSIIVQSFSEGEHEHISKILEELWKVHLILSNNKTNIYVCYHSTTSLFLDLDNSSINFDDNAEHPNTFCEHIKTAFKLHTKPLFILICLCRSVHFLTFMPIVTTIVDFSMDKGLHASDGKYVIGALSLGDLMGRLCLGWITDKGYVTLPRYMMVAMVIQGASTATLSFMDSRASLMSAIAIFGLLQGSIFVRHPVLVSRYLGSHEQSIAMGCINFFSGILAFALPSYIGYFRDTVGSYNGIFYINGAVGAFIGLLWVFEPYFFKLSVSRARRNQQAQV